MPPMPGVNGGQKVRLRVAISKRPTPAAGTSKSTEPSTPPSIPKLKVSFKNGKAVIHRTGDSVPTTSTEQSPNPAEMLASSTTVKTRVTKCSRSLLAPVVTSITSRKRRGSANDYEQSPVKKLRNPSGSDTDTLPSGSRRGVHNSMERQRRVNLRNCFENLQKMVPSISSKDKVPKVSILQEAASYCEQLSSRSTELQRDLKIQQTRRDQLRQKLLLLQTGSVMFS